MRKRIKSRKFFLIKSTAFIIAWCMLMGSVCFSALAKENTSEVLSDERIENGKKENNSENSQQKIESESDSGNDKRKEESENSGLKNDVNHDKGEEDPKDSGEGNNMGEGDLEDSSEGNNSGDDKENGDLENSGEESKDAEKEPESDDPEEESKDNEKETVSGNDVEKNESEDEEMDDREHEIIDVVVPSTYVLALNPYRLPIKVGENEISEEQIISGTYGIVNKSSTDQIVTVSLTVEDGNGGKVVFVDSAEEAENAGEGVYAVYLSVVPANDEKILIDGEVIDKDVSKEALQNVEMTGAAKQAVTLYEGTNEIAFKLSGAVYELEDDDESALIELAPDGSGVTAYTFSGVMNSHAPWEELSGGIKLSVVYTYQKADGSEEMVEGTVMI